MKFVICESKNWNLYAAHSSFLIVRDIKITEQSNLFNLFVISLLQILMDQILMFLYAYENQTLAAYFMLSTYGWQ